MVNMLVILAVVQVGSLFSADAWNNITFTPRGEEPQEEHSTVSDFGTGFVLTVYFLVSLGYLLVLPMLGDRVRYVWARAFNMRQRIAWLRRCWSRYFTPGRLPDGAAILISTFAARTA